MEDRGILSRIILNWISEKWGVKLCTGFIWIRTGICVGI